MFRLISFAIFVWCNVLAFGQPTIHADILPQVGDTVLLASDKLPEGISITGKGAHQQWDFTGLQSAFTQKIEVKSANEAGKKPVFKNADIVIEEMDGGKGFYKLTENKLELIARKGPDPLNLGIHTTTYFASPLQELNTPLKYGMTSEKDGRFSFKVAASDLSEEDLYALPITPDSVQYKCFINRKSEMDAWGILSLPDNTYEVLREKRTEIKELKLEIKVGALPWQDITDDVRDDRFKSKQLHRSYYFYSNETVLPIASAHLKPDGVSAETVFYTVTDPSLNMRTVVSGRPNIYVYPNPAINNVRFEFSNLKPSTYSLKIYNILGVVVMRKDYQLHGSKTIKLDISKLRKGTYLYSLTDAQGKTIATRRLMVIRP